MVNKKLNLGSIEVDFVAFYGVNNLTYKAECPDPKSQGLTSCGTNCRTNMLGITLEGRTNIRWWD